MQQNFCTYFRKKTPSNNMPCQKKFLGTRNILDWKRSGQWQTGEENIEYIRKIFRCSPAESTQAVAKNCNWQCEDLQFTGPMSCYLTHLGQAWSLCVVQVMFDSVTAPFFLLWTDSNKGNLFKNSSAVCSVPSEDLQPTLVFLHDGALIYWGKIAYDYLKE